MANSRPYTVLPSAPEEQDQLLRAKLDRLAKEIAADLSLVDGPRGKELLSDFVSDLFLSVADQTRREDRRQKQAQGIAAAKARGVRFGRPAPPLPESFEQYHQAWRSGEMSLRQAAAACGMPQSSFYNAATRREQDAGQAV